MAKKPTKKTKAKVPPIKAANGKAAKLKTPSPTSKAIGAARLIDKAFRWRDTVEGELFWLGVYERLEQIGSDGRLK